ncbi:hypothetical protein [Paraburkholderia silvatlantica]|uniref:Uncharacterized protein n=1 Tax=Paraburkholderia silvatlantica TaxID=321895 RepID=A0ABR6FNJ7_9BURK|nr:hypothetical protein [Paraburkholderia silvatlantica]MBB2929004.1 hypothetical protein [Paraburkholderia silvatlantica]
MPASACERGLEGIIGKQVEAPYRSRRSDRWITLKCNTRQEADYRRTRFRGVVSIRYCVPSATTAPTTSMNSDVEALGGRRDARDDAVGTELARQLYRHDLQQAHPCDFELMNHQPESVEELALQQSTIRRIASYVIEARHRRPAEASREAALRHIVDIMCAVGAGINEPGVIAIRATASRYLSSGNVPIWFAGVNRAMSAPAIQTIPGVSS